MSDRVSHIYDDDVLHITVKDALHNADHLPVWSRVFDISHQHGSERILLECVLNSDRISMAHCFEMIDRLPFLCRLLDCRIAMFEQNAGDEARELLRFVETAAQDRGASLRLFCGKDEATLWLRG